jgi:asparagine synthase (glutamine-hydrolysing)
MSALAGIFKFDRRTPVHEAEILALVRGVEKIAPDGVGSLHISNRAMAYGALHTTPESLLERQPLVRKGTILTWDGRLDNREEIQASVPETFEGTPTDLDLVSAAYRTWGLSCFARLLGDWAIALWDDRSKHLVLANDYMGVRRLFYRVDDDGIAWCTVLEPLVLTAPAKLHLDLEYFAGTFYPRPPLGTTPYREIRGLVPAHYLIFREAGKYSQQKYWSLNPHAKIRRSSDEEYEEEFRNIFRKSVDRRLRSNGAITAELSGGIDSSSIVCMADDIRRLHPGPDIETLSYYNVEEPSGDERPFFSIIEQARGRIGNHISMDEFYRQMSDYALAPLPEEHFVAAPGYLLKSLVWSKRIQAILEGSGSRVILSGLGGDELLGGVQYEAPELAEYLLQGRIIALCRSLMGWSIARRKTVYRLIYDTLQLLASRFDPAAFLRGNPPRCGWSRLSPPDLRPTVSAFATWKDLGPAQLNAESIRYSIASQLACTDPPLTGHSERRYPYLDRELFEFVSSVPRSQITHSAQRRSLMRRSLKELVPHEVLFRKTKWFGGRSQFAQLRDQGTYLRQMFDEPWLSDGVLIDAAQLRNELLEIDHGSSTLTSLMLSAVSVEQWLRVQVKRGFVGRTQLSGKVDATIRSQPHPHPKL